MRLLLLLMLQLVLEMGGFRVDRKLGGWVLRGCDDGRNVDLGEEIIGIEMFPGSGINGGGVLNLRSNWTRLGEGGGLLGDCRVRQMGGGGGSGGGGGDGGLLGKLNVGEGGRWTRRV